MNVATSYGSYWPRALRFGLPAPAMKVPAPGSVENGSDGSNRLIMPYLLFVVVLPIACTGAAVALLAGAFSRGRQPHLLRVLGAVGFLLATGLLILVTATGAGYSGLAAAHELIVASAAALVGAVILVLKPPAARRVAAVLLVTAYPLVLFGLGLAGSMLSSGTTHWLVVKAARAAAGWFA